MINAADGAVRARRMFQPCLRAVEKTELRTQGGEGFRALPAAEAAGYLHLHLYHPDILLGLVVGCASERCITLPGKVIGAAVWARYPFMQAPAEAVASGAGLDNLAHIATPEALLTHRLMAIEAAAINDAARYFGEWGELALPMHDSLIVSRSAARRAQGYLEEAYVRFAKIKPYVTFFPELTEADLTAKPQPPDDEGWTAAYE